MKTLNFSEKHPTLHIGEDMMAALAPLSGCAQRMQEMSFISSQLGKTMQEINEQFSSEMKLLSHILFMTAKDLGLGLPILNEDNRRDLVEIANSSVITEFHVPPMPVPVFTKSKPFTVVYRRKRSQIK